VSLPLSTTLYLQKVKKNSGKHSALRFPANTNVSFFETQLKSAYILTESDKLYKTLFNSISHELRIPVATIMGASDTLLTQNLPEEVKKKSVF